MIVSFHGGAEGRSAQHVADRNEIFLGENRGNVVRFARSVVEAGADLVLGHGPHVLRAMEVYQGKLIAYSLGNFLTYGLFNLKGANGISAILKVRLDPETGRFLDGQLVPVKLVNGGLPEIDPEGEGVRIVRRLSEEDLDSRQLTVDENGCLRVADGTRPMRVGKESGRWKTLNKRSWPRFEIWPPARGLNWSIPISGVGSMFSRRIPYAFFVGPWMDLKTLDDVEQALRQERERPWRQLTKPLWVEYRSQLPEEISFQFPLTENLPPDRLTQLLRIELLIEEEEGYQRIQSFESEAVRIKETQRIAEGLFQRAGIPFPRGLPLGIHRFSLSVALQDKRWEQEITVILCPDRAYLPPVLAEGGKRAGLMAAVHGLRSARNWGIGDFSDLKKLAGWAADRLRVDVIGVLPLHALVNREPYNISPYYPTSRFYRNTIYLDVTAIEEYHQSWPARALACSPDFVKMIIELRDSEMVEYEVAAQLKGMVLEEIFKTFHGKALEA